MTRPLLEPEPFERPDARPPMTGEVPRLSQHHHGAARVEHLDTMDGELLRTVEVCACGSRRLVIIRPDFRESAGEWAPVPVMPGAPQ